jgi:hypothetical protein
VNEATDYPLGHFLSLLKARYTMELENNDNTEFTWIPWVVCFRSGSGPNDQMSVPQVRENARS